MMENEKSNYPILIVDDETEIIQALTLYLSDYTIDHANDAEAALQKIKQGRYKIVLTDIVMPGMDGIDLLRQIKKINPGIQVIVMTGQTTLMRAAESMQEGALTYLLKPFDDITVVDQAIENAIKKIEEWKKIMLLSSASKESSS